jgi:hypothetical protein
LLQILSGQRQQRRDEAGTHRMLEPERQFKLGSGENLALAGQVKTGKNRVNPGPALWMNR